MNTIVDFVADLSYEDLPENVVHSARLCLMDAIGCMIGGMQNQSVADLAGNISKQNPGPTRIAGTSYTSTRPWASFLNSHSCSFFDLDDGHRKAQGHPGGVVVPVSLLLAAENGCSGKELLAAIVAGYETAVRSALIMRQEGGPRKGSGGWNITGGVAAAAKLSDFSKPQIKNALGMAEYYAPQAPQDRSLAYPSSMKEGMAWAAHSAITITQLAGVGFDAMTPFLSGAKECEDLGSNWEILSTYFKMYGCCRFAHPVLDGLASLIKKDISPEDIETIRVSSFAKALLLNHLTPDNPVAAMYSIPFIIGCFLVKGRVGPQEMTADSLSDNRILAVAQKVMIEEDSEITRQFPLKCLAGVEVGLHNGTILKSEILSAKGDPDKPYSLQEMRTKFIGLTQSLPHDTGKKVYEMIMKIEEESPFYLWELL
jgi:2-methylcitrate dehydratase PrpD